MEGRNDTVVQEAGPVAESVVDVHLCPDCGAPRYSGDWPICDDGTGKHGHTRPHGGTRLSSIHPSERAVVYRNPRTGEIRYPPRADQAMPAAYARQGFVREELSTPQEVRSFEKSTGRIHERSHYDPGSGTADREMEAPLNAGPSIEHKEEVRRKLVQAIS